MHTPCLCQCFAFPICAHTHLTITHARFIRGGGDAVCFPGGAILCRNALNWIITRIIGIHFNFCNDFSLGRKMRPEKTFERTKNALEIVSKSKIWSENWARFCTLSIFERGFTSAPQTDSPPFVFFGICCRMHANLIAKTQKLCMPLRHCRTLVTCDRHAKIAHADKLQMTWNRFVGPFFIRLCHFSWNFGGFVDWIACCWFSVLRILCACVCLRLCVLISLWYVERALPSRL